MYSVIHPLLSICACVTVDIVMTRRNHLYNSGPKRTPISVFKNFSSLIHIMIITRHPRLLFNVSCLALYLHTEGGDIDTGILYAKKKLYNTQGLAYAPMLLTESGITKVFTFSQRIWTLTYSIVVECDRNIAWQPGINPFSVNTIPIGYSFIHSNHSWWYKSGLSIIIYFLKNQSNSTNTS